ncbi:MAG: hypothetical protein IT353_07580 [Gemmatimonadaceae bacterium]|nr:hypothetical protein [Gemmatimonadaceae bacterium]
MSQYLRISRCGMYVLLACVLVPALRAQNHQPPTEAMQIARDFRDKGWSDVVADVVTDRYGRPRVPAVYNAIADSLMAFILGDAPPNSVSRTRTATTQPLEESRLRALRALAAAARHPSISNWAAGERLLRIVEYAPDTPVRAVAIGGILSLPDSAQALSYLHRIATSQNPVAYAAVHPLWKRMGEEGRRLLERLYRDRRVVEPSALREITLIARKSGWDQPPP